MHTQSFATLALALLSGGSPAPAQTTWLQSGELVSPISGCCWQTMAYDDGVCVAGVRDTVVVFERDSLGSWTETANFMPSGVGLQAVPEVSVDGGTIVAGFANVGLGGGPFFPGLAIVYERDAGGTWTETARFSASDGVNGDHFGSSVSLSGDVVAVGKSSYQGSTNSVYVFERSGTSPSIWAEVAKLQAPLPTGSSFQNYGYHLDLEQHTLVVGDQTSNHSGVNIAGAAFVYERDPVSPVWTLTSQLQAHDPGPGDSFGSVSLDGNRLVVGAGGDSHSVDFQGLAPDPVGGGFYAVDDDDGLLYRIDSIGIATPVGPIGMSTAYGLACDVITNTVFVTNKNNNAKLRVISGATGVATQLGASGFGNVRGLAFDPNTGMLYGSSNNGTPSLITIDTTTGVGSLVGVTGLNGINGLAFDAVSGTLYGVTATDALVTLDTATGAGTVVATVSLPGVKGLEFDSNTGSLVGSIPGTDQIVSIDPLTGQAGSPMPIDGAPYFYPAGTPYVSGSIYHYERSTEAPGAWDFIGKFGLQGSTGLIGSRIRLDGDTIVSHFASEPVSILGFTGGAWSLAASFPFTTNQQGITLPIAAADGVIAVGDRDPSQSAGVVRFYSAPSMNYCTAGISASGCQANISGSGLASATATSGFSVSVAGLEGNKLGHFYFGVNGKQANPWGNGTSYQCVQPPVRRAPGLPVTGTSGQCDGALSQDLNALWCPTCPKPHQNPGAGNFVQAQFWYRDPQNTSNQTTSLSDALESFVTP